MIVDWKFIEEMQMNYKHEEVFNLSHGKMQIKTSNNTSYLSFW